MDAVCRAIVEVMKGAGIVVEITEADGDVMVTARTPDGHTHVVHGDDLYRTLCVAAREGGVELDDG